MPSPQLDSHATVSSTPTVVRISHVEASNWLEFGLTAICLIIVVIAFFRRTSKTVFLLLGGLAFLMLKHAMFLAILWLQPQTPLIGSAAGYAGSLGWLLVCMYCGGLLFAPRGSKA